MERRRKLLELTDQYSVPIVEDDPYRQLRYEGEHQPSIVVRTASFKMTELPDAGETYSLWHFLKDACTRITFRGGGSASRGDWQAAAG